MLRYKSKSLIVFFSTSFSLWILLAEVNLDKHQRSKAHLGKIDIFGREKCEMCEKTYDHENNMIAHQNDEGHSNDPVAVRYWGDYKIESEENNALRYDLTKVKNSLQECQPFVQLAQITNHLSDVLIWDSSHQNGVISCQYYRLVRLQAVRDIKSSELLWRLECYVNQKINSRKGYIIAKEVTQFL